MIDFGKRMVIITRMAAPLSAGISFQAMGFLFSFILVDFCPFLRGHIWAVTELRVQEIIIFLDVAPCVLPFDIFLGCWCCLLVAASRIAQQSLMFAPYGCAAR